MNIIKYKTFYLVLSILMMVPGALFLIKEGLNLGIDFTGGSVSRYEFTQDVSVDRINEIYSKNNVQDVQITKTDKKILARSKPVETGVNARIVSAIQDVYKGAKQTSFETVGPTVGAETTKKAFLSVLISSLAILLFMAYSFKDIPKPYSSFKFGAAAIIAMLHDAFLVVGIFSILGHYLNVEIDALFITALLTVIGFSVHDTIVVFDRIRENLGKLPKNISFDEVVNFSLIETMNRSIITSLTVLITLLALFVLGGVTIKYFVLALLVGILSGTYSSIFVASPILVLWESISSKANRK